MTTPKKLPTKRQVERGVALFAALAHPIRLTVLAALSRRGPLPAGALQEIAKVEQSAMSHQLRALRNAQLVESERYGRHVIYRVKDEHVACIVADGLAHAAEYTAATTARKKAKRKS